MTADLLALRTSVAAVAAQAPSGVATPSVVSAVWAVLATVLDPEVPVLSLCDLGIVRDVKVDGMHIDVVLTPTYSGCPATEVIAQSVQDALALAGFGDVTLTQQLSPAWTTDWISDAGRQKLRAYGIAPPSGTAAVQSTVRIRPRNVACPRCSSLNTERLSAFGATACKALHRCLECLEPFEHFKPI
jgi:ring-1,2-phenylacetyl-CoA epoxidase subunit PaaD